MESGAIVRKFGKKGSGPSEFRFGFGGLCAIRIPSLRPGRENSHSSLLIADGYNHRIQQINLLGIHVRNIGESALDMPQCVTASVEADVIAVTEQGKLPRVSVFSFGEGKLLRQITATSSCALSRPHGIRLLRNAGELIVCDAEVNRIVIFNYLSGAFVRELADGSHSLANVSDVEVLPLPVAVPMAESPTTTCWMPGGPSSSSESASQAGSVVRSFVAVNCIASPAAHDSEDSKSPPSIVLIREHDRSVPTSGTRALPAQVSELSFAQTGMVKPCDEVTALALPIQANFSSSIAYCTARQSLFVRDFDRVIEVEVPSGLQTASDGVRRG